MTEYDLLSDDATWVPASARASRFNSNFIPRMIKKEKKI